jgi:hypothetical protein
MLQAQQYMHTQTLTSGTQQLPPVETIKENKNMGNNSGGRGVSTEELSVSSALAAAAAENNSTTTNPDQLHLIGSVQLSMDGPTLQFTGLDLASLQMDENFLQNVTNVIFLPQNQGTADLASAGSNNMIIGMLPEVNSDVLTGKDVSLSHLNMIGPSGGDQLTGPLTLSSAGDVNVNHYVINNNEMMSSTARPAAARTPHYHTTVGDPNSSILPGNKVCNVCNKVFSTPSQLLRHQRGVHDKERPYRYHVHISHILQS